MNTFLWIGAGGFLGANARYLMTLLVNKVVQPRLGMFPYGTLFVNVTGSLLLAVFSVWISHHLDISPNIKLIVATGFFGAYTTFSTFANESIGLYDLNGLSPFIINVIVTNILCLVGVLLGVALANRLWSA